MPEAVAEYVRTRDVVANRVYESLFAAYVDDIPKYSRNESMVKILWSLNRFMEMSPVTKTAVRLFELDKTSLQPSEYDQLNPHYQSS